MRDQKAMGHRFGPDLICPCGEVWDSFQTDPKPCPLPPYGSTPSTDEKGDTESEKATTE